MFKKKNEVNWFVIIFQLIILLSILGIIIHSYNSGSLSSNNFIIVLVIVLLMGIPVFISVRVKLNQKISHNEQSIKFQKNNHIQHDNNSQQGNPIPRDNGIQQNTNSTPGVDENYQRTYVSGGDMPYKTDEKSTMKPKQAAKSKLPAIIPIAVLGFTGLYMAFGNPLDLLNNNDPTGKWYLDFEVYGGGGNLTEYLFYEFNEDGTLDVGTKVSGGVEYAYSGTQGSWYIDDGIIYATHRQWNGSSYVTVNFQLKVKDNKLYSIDGIDTGYRRTSKWVS